MHERGDANERVPLVVIHPAGIVTVIEFLLDESGTQAPLGKTRPFQDGGEKAHVVGDATQIKRIERELHSGDRRRSVVGVDNQLGNHRIIENGNLVSLAHTAVESHVLTGRRLETHQPTRRRQEPTAWILGIDSCLDRPAVHSHVRLLDAKGLVCSDTNHELYEIEPGYRFCDWMFYLKPRVHLEEVEIPIRIDDELHRSRRVISDRARQSHRLRTHGGAHLRIDKGGW